MVGDPPQSSVMWLNSNTGKGINPSQGGGQEGQALAEHRVLHGSGLRKRIDSYRDGNIQVGEGETVGEGRKKKIFFLYPLRFCS